MGAEAGQYHMQCWNSTKNPEQMNRPKLVYQCFQLIKALQDRFANGELAIPSTDIKRCREGIEICILYRADRNLFGDIAAFLSKTAASLSLDYSHFVKQAIGITRHFTQQEIENVSILSKPVPDYLTEETVIQFVTTAESSTGFRVNDEWINGIPAQHRAPAMQITRTTLQRLHNAEGTDMVAVIRKVLQAILSAKHQTKTAWQVITMIATGAIASPPAIATIDPSMAGTALGVVLVYTLLGVRAVAATVGVLVEAVAVFSGTTYLVFKDAANVLLVVNDTSSDILPFGEYIHNGERQLVADSIPAAVHNRDLVYCGLFIYGKYMMKNHTVGTYGSAFGVSFNTSYGNFSLGMDCPNGILDGHNSIEVHDRRNAQDACFMAVKSECLHGWIDKPYVDVKAADKWGNINWGRAIFIRESK